MDSTTRFSNRAQEYARARPSYPPALIDHLQRNIGLSAEWEVADIGSGTGISARLFLDAGCCVFAVEPNHAMRAEAETALAARPNFTSVDATAEATTLPKASVELIVAAQAFHWFDVDACRAEFARILKSPGYVALIWNQRKTDTTPFLRAYEAALHEFGTDYEKVAKSHEDQTRIRRLLSKSEEARFPNAQQFDLDGLLTRAMSSSYLPGPGEPGHDALMERLRQIFAELARSGLAEFEYDTQLFVGTL